MGFLQRIRRIGRQLSYASRTDGTQETASRLRICRVEDMEERQYLAADVHLGAVYFEDATGDDSQGDTLQVTFEGGDAGTELSRVVIDGDKEGNGPSSGDVFFDTAPGGEGAFGSSPLTIASSDGFQVLNYTVSDGGSRITFDLAGFKAGMKLVFTVDTDEIQFVDPATGNWDVNAIVEGGEFQRSHLHGTFEAEHFENATGHALFWDAYDDEFATEAAKTGTTLNLPPDRYTITGDFVDRTAGAVTSVKQVPLPITLVGTVFEDKNLSNTQQTSEPGIAGVSLSLLAWNGSSYVSTGKTAVTNAAGDYKFDGLLPGKYRVVETQPNGYFSVGASAGKVDGSIRGVVASPDILSDITLLGGEDSVNNDFAEAKPNSISGRVHIDNDGDCVFTPGDEPLAGVVIQLRDATGVVIRTTTTDVNGEYRFDDLLAGTYAVFEVQPAGLLDDDEMVGTAGGEITANDLISNIVLTGGVFGEHYDFCEIRLSSLSGYVHVDDDGDCIFDPEERGLAGVVIQLLDPNGTVLRVTTTDVDGFYKFDDLEPGEYQIRELQPAGYLDSEEEPGSEGGVVLVNDVISQIPLAPGRDGVEYNFCEVLPASIRGRVHADTDGDCEFDPGEQPLAGVGIQLFDADGQLVASTATDELGEYVFSGLTPGSYTVHEIQPSGYFDGGQDAGSAGGIESDDTISQIDLGSGVDAVEYNFCEKPPALISGYVFQDGPAISVAAGQSPDVPALRDGLLTPDDKRLSGVVLELRDGVTGQPIFGSATLGGKYPADQIVTAVTDANGYYEFIGIRGGSYAVYERQDPAGYIDGINTAGSTGGIVMSAYTQVEQGVLDQLTELPASGDAILQIVVSAGGSSLENNFSEVTTETPFFFFNPPPISPPQLYPVNVWLPPPPPLLPPPPPPQLDVPKFLYGGSTRNYTWHLSVIDAGHPRGDAVAKAPLQQVASQADELTWNAAELKKSRWTLTKRTPDGKIAPTREIVFGLINSVPITGDFNGDGVTDVGAFKEGEWFIDVNGNGQWDADDLWAKLGTRDDKPVTGDWNGDGKTDIGIYGPAWPRDPHAVKHEPGIPDPANTTRDARKNHPPRSDKAALGARSLKLTADGKTRADLIDHVFHYGTATEVPITGDWNGDGIDTIGIFSGGKWYRDLDGDGRWSPADRVANFGRENDKPVPGDWNGDGRDELGVYRAGTWYLDTNGNEQLDAGDEVIKLGGPNDAPVVGDWDGDGRDEVGIVQGGQIIHGERLTQLLRQK